MGFVWAKLPKPPELPPPKMEPPEAAGEEVLVEPPKMDPPPPPKAGTCGCEAPNKLPPLPEVEVWPKTL